VSQNLVKLNEAGPEKAISLNRLNQTTAPYPLTALSIVSNATNTAEPLSNRTGTSGGGGFLPTQHARTAHLIVHVCNLTQPFQQASRDNSPVKNQEYLSNIRHRPRLAGPTELSAECPKRSHSHILHSVTRPVVVLRCVTEDAKLVQPPPVQSILADANPQYHSLLHQVL